MIIRKKSGTWSVDAMDGQGNRIRKSGFTYCESARDMDRAIERSRANKQAYRQNGGLTLGELAVKYLSDGPVLAHRDIKGRISRINCIVAALGEETKAADLTPQRIHEYQDMRLGSGLSVAAANRPVAYLHGMLVWAVRKGLLDTNPITGYRPVRGEVVRNRYVTVEEFLALRSMIAERSRPVLTLLYLLPLRKGEIATLKWAMVDLKSPIPGLRIPAGLSKSGRPRAVPFYYVSVRDLIAELPTRFKGAVEPFERLFGITTAQFRADFEKQRFAVPEKISPALDGLRIHDLRHTAITNLLLAGVPAHEIQHASDHKGPVIQARYTHVQSEMLLNPRERVYDPVTGLISPDPLSLPDTGASTPCGSVCS